MTEKSSNFHTVHQLLKASSHSVELRNFLLMIFEKIGKCVVCISSSILCVTRLVLLWTNVLYVPRERFSRTTLLTTPLRILQSKQCSVVMISTHSFLYFGVEWARVCHNYFSQKLLRNDITQLRRRKSKIFYKKVFHVIP